MRDLVKWLHAQLDEDERTAVSGESWTAFDESTQGTRRVDVDHSFERVVACTRSWRGEHIAAWDPARVLRETDTKRALLRRANGGVDHPHAHPGEDDADHLRRHHDDELLRLLALPYADRPGYRAEWKPKPPAP